MCSLLQPQWRQRLCLTSAAVLCTSGYLALELRAEVLVSLSHLSVISDVCLGRSWGSDSGCQACKAPLLITVKEFLHLSLVILRL